MSRALRAASLVRTSCIVSRALRAASLCWAPRSHAINLDHQPRTCCSISVIADSLRTAPVPPGGGPPPSGPYAQARLCLELIGEALAQAGTHLEYVVRTRMYLTAAEHWREVARAHGEVFAAVRPAATAVIVAGLLDPAWLVEIEAEALLPGDDTRD